MSTVQPAASSRRTSALSRFVARLLQPRNVFTALVLSPVVLVVAFLLLWTCLILVASVLPT